MSGPVGHVTRTVAEGPDGWRCKCTCQLETDAYPTYADAERVGYRHRRIIRTGNQRALDAQQDAHTKPFGPTFESYALAEKHITRCPILGAQIWDGFCPDCKTIHTTTEDKA